MAVAEIAAAHYRRQVALARRASTEIARIWGEVDQTSIASSWLALLEVVLAVLSSAQAIASASSGVYVSDVVDELGIDPETRGRVNVNGFAGTAADGRELDSLMFLPAVSALELIGKGATVRRAMAAGALQLDTIVRTEVADAGRVADGVAIVARPALAGYVRMLSLPSCDDCIILAGRFYRWNDGFERHNRCDCRHIPSSEDVAGDLRTDPKAAFESMSEVEQDRAFTKAGARAIRDGADMPRVVNARKSLYTAGGKKLTREATTRRGTGRRVRLAPEQIYIEAGDDRDRAIRLLKLHGYLI